VKRTIALAAGYLAVTLVMMQSMINFGALGSAVYQGDAQLIVWTLAWANHALLDGMPLFDANIFYPAAASLQYNEHLIGISLFTLPIYAATRNPVLAYNVVWILSFVLNALAMHALAYRHTRSHAAAASAALIFTFSFYKMLHAHGHLAHIWTWLMPLSLWLLERWIERPRPLRAAAWAAAVVLQALGSWYTAVMILLINAIALLWLGMTFRDRWRARVTQLVVVTAVGILIVAPFAGRYSSLEPPPRSAVMSLSVDWQSYFVPPADTLAGRWWTARINLAPGSIWGERTVFLGWIATTMALAGATALVLRREWVRAGVALSCVLVGLVLSFGPSATTGEIERLSAFGLFASIPGMSGFRVPARFALVVLFGVSVLAAEAARTLAQAARSSSILLIVLWPVMLAEWYVISMPGGRPAPMEIPAIYRTAEVRSARALVSLPDYRATYEWWAGGDYLYYSTAHWRPIVNGFGRSEPPEHPHVISYMKAFPGPNNARKMRELGIEYLIVHGARYPGGVEVPVRAAVESGEYELAQQIGTDYLIRVRPK
jgi:hypothetical protein